MEKPTDQARSELENAMQEAVAAVEARERDASRASRDEPPAPEAEQPSAQVAEAPPPPLTVEAAKAEMDEALAKAKTEVQELKDRWLRAAADLDNFKKRSAREREDAIKFGNERLLRDLLPVLDDLDRTLEAVGQATEAAPGGATLIEGVRMVQKKFLAQLEKNGVEAFSAAGQAFDPNLHEAVQQIPSEQVAAGGVAQELRRGFMLAGRLLRPALVAVSIGPGPGAKE